ncbi:uncharacterized protein VTP21DRAFT_9472 [Calcarisporiella thermophila]|uniref:uncharacterized protein n=1 Tax=Calcarisporiella thermophila TaxID=911321 RepID=UPI003744914B
MKIPKIGSGNRKVDPLRLNWISYRDPNGSSAMERKLSESAPQRRRAEKSCIGSHRKVGCMPYRLVQYPDHKEESGNSNQVAPAHGDHGGAEEIRVLLYTCVPPLHRRPKSDHEWTLGCMISCLSHSRRSREKEARVRPDKDLERIDVRKGFWQGTRHTCRMSQALTSDEYHRAP